MNRNEIKKTLFARSLSLSGQKHGSAKVKIIKTKFAIIFLQKQKLVELLLHETI